MQLNHGAHYIKTKIIIKINEFMTNHTQKHLGKIRKYKLSLYTIGELDSMSSYKECTGFHLL